MTREWQPGDVALIEVGGRTARAMRQCVQGDSLWSSAERLLGVYDHYDAAGPVTVVRPLVVIDPEDREQVERLSEMVADEIVRNGLKPRDAMQAALREYANPTPPKCKAALNIKGEHYGCDLDADHDGLAHSSKRAEAIWGERP